MQFEVVQGCQLRCIGCPISTLTPKVRFMDVDRFEAALKNVGGVKVIHKLALTIYGEPLLHPDVAGLLTAVGRRKWDIWDVEITTNGQKIDRAQLAEMMATKVLGRLVISADGDGTPESYERVRPPARWSKLMEFIKVAAELRDKHQPSLKLVARSIVPTKEACAKWVSLLEPLGWDSEFRVYYPMPKSTRSVEDPPVPGKGLCHYVQRRHLYVDVDLRVVPCGTTIGVPGWGDLSTTSLRDIRSGDARRDFVRALATDRAGLICAECAYGKGTDMSTQSDLDSFLNHSDWEHRTPSLVVLKIPRRKS